jgi:hypothetical protein
MALAYIHVIEPRIKGNVEVEDAFPARLPPVIYGSNFGARLSLQAVSMQTVPKRFSRAVTPI